MAPQRSHSANRLEKMAGPQRGLTLIELVMVVALLGLLAAIAIPGVQFAVEGRAVREAARSVNVYLGAARNRAMTTGRPVGVAFQRFSNDDPYDNMCLTLQQVEGPPSYAGDTMSARAKVYFNTSVLTVQMDAGFDATKVAVGDIIQFNSQGPWHSIATVSGTTLTLVTEANRLYPWPSAVADAELMPYEIRRQPRLSATLGITRATFSKPLQLPLEAVVDLTFSGLPADAMDTQGHFSVAKAGSTDPVVVMFSPSGGIEGVYYGSARVQNQPVFLLLGRRDRIPAGSADDGKSNLQDPNSLWVSVSPRSGLITTSQNVEVSADSEINAARFFTTDQQGMGGR